MSNPATPPSKSAATLIFEMIEENGPSPTSLGLLGHLIAAGRATMEDQVQGSDGNLVSLREAILHSALPGRFCPGFYTQENAEQLLALDPEIFQAPAGSTTSWLEKNLAGWARMGESERSRVGFGTVSFQSRQLVVLDHWASRVIASLSSEEQKSEGLWVACLELGFHESAKQIARNDPSLWSRCESSGRPLIAKASGAWVWQTAIENGLDPLQVGVKNKPLWRTMLPLASDAQAAPGSVRQGVEAWLVSEIKKPNSDPAMFDYIKNSTLRRMSTNMGGGSWYQQSTKDKIDFVAGLPPEWVSWKGPQGYSLWLEYLAPFDNEMADWLRPIAKSKELLSHLDGIDRVALWFLYSNHATFQKPKSPPPADCMQLLHTEAAQFVLKKAAEIAEEQYEALSAFLVDQSLHAFVPGASAPPRKTLRL